MHRCVPKANLVRCTCHFKLTNRILEYWTVSSTDRRDNRQKSDLFSFVLHFFVCVQLSLPFPSSAYFPPTLFLCCCVLCVCHSLVYFLSSSLLLFLFKHTSRFPPAQLKTKWHPGWNSSPHVHPFRSFSSVHQCMYTVTVRLFSRTYTVYRHRYLLLQSCCYILKTLRAGVVLIPDHSPAQRNTQWDTSKV